MEKRQRDKSPYKITIKTFKCLANPFSFCYFFQLLPKISVNQGSPEIEEGSKNMSKFMTCDLKQMLGTVQQNWNKIKRNIPSSSSVFFKNRQYLWKRAFQTVFRPATFGVVKIPAALVITRRLTADRTSSFWRLCFLARLITFYLSRR